MSETQQDYTINRTLDAFDDIFGITLDSGQDPNVQDIKHGFASLARAVDGYLIASNSPVPQTVYDRAITDMLAAQLMLVKCVTWK